MRVAWNVYWAVAVSCLWVGCSSDVATTKVDAYGPPADAIIVIPPDAGKPIITIDDAGRDTPVAAIDAPVALGDSAPPNPCGNSVLDIGEACDDGNQHGGDGCDGTCKLENGWICPTPGQPCISTLYCGDGIPGPDESCDDGNKLGDDGCSATCTIESGYVCPVFGQPCEPTVKPPECGNGAVEFGETCDDNNIVPNDGCSDTCQTEKGWICVGTKCTRVQTCGDGSLDPTEQCDDGNRIPGDCCGATCKLEANCRCITPPPDAGAPGQICVSTIVCGDGVVAGSEACDDKNTKAGDGCAADCSKTEPGFTCPPAGGACAPAVVLCPNARLDPGETCDDGNGKSLDGCSANCKVEPGYVCPTVGSLCKLKEVCGDGKVSYILGEICDDGNVLPDDGCSATCKIEAGYNCDNAASPSLCSKEACGNKRIGAGETCDDGNAASDDGCSSTCQLETGYTCPALGLPCRAICGDGLIRGTEQCDDDDTEDDDGCNSLCRLEPGYVCEGTTCRRTTCGDKIKEGTEQCDDTAVGAVDVPFDGCYHCMKEPDCAAGACQSACGDGQRFNGEDCDDGNLYNGDGCSSTCKKETGYNCSDEAATALPATKTYPVVVRDFIGLGRQISPASYHPDFNHHVEHNSTTDGYGAAGIFKMVKTTLGANGKPQWRWLPFSKTSVDAVNSGALNNAIPAALSGCTCDEAAASASWTASSETWGAGTIGSSVSFDLLHPPCSCTNGTVCVCDNPGHLYKDRDYLTPKLPENTGRRELSTPGNLDQWFTDVTGVNLRVPYLLTLTQIGTTGTYSNLSDPNATSFDPLGNGGWIADAKESASGCTGDQDTVNVSFTTETHFWFEYDGGEEFAFTGDDDTWVFVNKILAVDLGGLHNKCDGSFTLDASNGTAVSKYNEYGTTYYYDGTNYSTTQGDNLDLGLVPGKVYEVVMFQAERNQCGSNFGVTLKNFEKPKSKCSAQCGDGIVAASEACDLGAANTGSYGGCNADCTLGPYCGDGTVNGTEACDDGLNANVYGPAANGCAPGCKTAPTCGDSKVDVAFGETCDNGATNSATAYGAGACTDKCQTAGYCGDGLVNGTEACDDGQNNGTPASKCNTKCAIKCGDGVLDGGEQCDKGTSLNTGVYGGCKADCTLAPYCGDGVKQPAAGEECDDGKNDGSYGTCTKTCKLAPHCGDSKLDVTGGEVCDMGAANQISPYGVSLCTTMCKPAPFCGDHSVDAAFGEKCDDGTNNSDSVPGACRADCSGYNPPPITCGNEKIEAGETCDEGALNGTPGSLCDGRCQLKCGNGIKDANEECDDGINDGEYGTCKNDCTLAPYCGDGTKDANEQCDLGILNSATAYGPGKCTPQCVVAPYCGDGRVNGTEACDGQSNCTLACTIQGPIL